MKIWCEECKGMQWIENNRCPFCKGEGYTENETVEYEAKVGRSAIKAFGVGGWFVIPKSYDAESPRHLIRWAENEENK